MLYIEKVSKAEFQTFCMKLSKGEAFGEVMEVRESIGKGYSEYHFNLNIGQGEGAIRIGYEHNSCAVSKAYTMRLEFNPSKQSEKDYEGFWRVFKALFKGHVKKIKQVDLAFDIAVHPFQLISTSLTGRQRTILKDTTYFGSRGNHGRLKIYNKRKEIENRTKTKFLDDSELTRIEYTYKFDVAVTAQMFSKTRLGFSEQYKVAMLDVNDMSGELKSMVLAYHHGMVQWKEFTRTSKNKVKKALDNMILLDLDHVYSKAVDDTVKRITSYFK